MNPNESQLKLSHTLLCFDEQLLHISSCLQIACSESYHFFFKIFSVVVLWIWLMVLKKDQPINGVLMKRNASAKPSIHQSVNQSIIFKIEYQISIQFQFIQLMYRVFICTFLERVMVSCYGPFFLFLLFNFSFNF